MERSIQPFQLPATLSVAIFPNPGCCQYELRWQAASLSDYDITLWNAAGQVCRNWTVPHRFACEQIFQFRQEELVAGNYFVGIAATGQRIGTVKLVISE